MPFLALLVSPRFLLALAAVAALGVAYLKGRSDGAAPIKAKLAQEQAEWANERANAADLARQWEFQAHAADQKARDTERTWQEAARSIDRDGTQEIEKQRARARRADAAASGLSGVIDAIAADATHAASAAQGAADARQRQAIAEAARVSAELLGQCHSASRARSIYADQAAAAGERCERWADALEKGQGPAP